ncbi:MAG: PHP domain-containing protein, partial [Candidatus Muiribacteriaceae bacterium]
QSDKILSWGDLHIHTTFSDGSHSVHEVLDMSAEQGLSTVAITDHDSVQGVEEALVAGETLGIKVIRGVEISVEEEKDEIHVLGFFSHALSETFRKEMERIRKTRFIRAEKILQDLSEHGIDLDMKNILKRAGSDYVGRPHIADEMVSAGICGDRNEVFREYLVFGKPGYAKRSNGVTLEKAFHMIKAEKGLVFVAHPALYPEPEILLERVIELGFDGIEVFHPSHNDGFSERLLKICRDNSLLVSGGSDFHHTGDSGNYRPGCVKLDNKYIKEIEGAF